MSIDKRYDFAILFDVKDGNPNGDPDAGNLPRLDPETGHGLVTDVCLKRKLRNFVLLTEGGRARYDIFVKEKSILNQRIDEGYRALGLDPDKAKKAEEKKDKSKARRDEIQSVRTKMCSMFFDVRAFGAVLSTGANAGQVRGPVQLTCSRSVNTILALEQSITRVAVTSEKDAEVKETEMGRKAMVPYGLYLGYGFINPGFADENRPSGTGFNAEDLKVLWKALQQMFEHDRSAARGLMTTRRVIVFEHDSQLGSASAASLFERIQVASLPGVEAPRSFKDFAVVVDLENLPNGIRVLEPTPEGELIPMDTLTRA
jgi:CRISPR-associated protein Csd2